jgi:hypothetical protein
MPLDKWFLMSEGNLVFSSDNLGPHNLEDEGTRILHNVRNHLPSDAASDPRIMESSTHCYDTSELNMRCQGVVVFVLRFVHNVELHVTGHMHLNLIFM